MLTPHTDFTPEEEDALERILIEEGDDGSDEDLGQNPFKRSQVPEAPETPDESE